MRSDCVLDGDGSDVPEFMPALAEPIINGTHDFVIGSRTRGKREPGSMNAQQVFAVIWPAFIRALYGVRYSDIVAVRAIGAMRWKTRICAKNVWLESGDADVNAAGSGLRILEIPVIIDVAPEGVSKVSGLYTTFVASFRILATFLRIAFER